MRHDAMTIELGGAGRLHSALQAPGTGHRGGAFTALAAWNVGADTRYGGHNKDTRSLSLCHELIGH